MTGIFSGILSAAYLKRDAKKGAENRNDRGSIALVVMFILMNGGLVSFIVKDAVRDHHQNVKTIQMVQQVREIDPNGPKK